MITLPYIRIKFIIQMSVSTIELKIDSAKKESDSLLKKKYSWQEDVDSLLDRINELNGHLATLHKVLLYITFEIERDFSSFKKSENGFSTIKKITQDVSKMLVIVRKSDLFPGVKSIYYLLKTENNYLRELYLDGKVGLELEEDDEMKKIMADSLNALKKL